MLKETKRGAYLYEHVKGINRDFAAVLAGMEKTRAPCDAAFGEGTYKSLLQFADDAFPDDFLESRYVKEITAPETGMLAHPNVIPYKDWAVTMIQYAIEKAVKETAEEGDDEAAIMREMPRVMDDVLAEFREEREREKRKDRRL